MPTWVLKQVHQSFVVPLPKALGERVLPPSDKSFKVEVEKQSKPSQSLPIVSKPSQTKLLGGCSRFKSHGSQGQQRLAKERSTSCWNRRVQQGEGRLKEQSNCLPRSVERERKRERRVDRWVTWGSTSSSSFSWPGVPPWWPSRTPPARPP